MPEGIAFDGTTDPLWRDPPLRHRTEIPVLGIPVRYESNAAAVLETIEAAFGAWRGLDPGLREPEGVSVRIVVHPGDEGGHVHAPVTHRLVGAFRVLYSTPGSVALADPDRREARAFVTPVLVADREHFRHAVVEALTLGTVTPLDRQPFHAAALVRDGAAVLLTGPSGVGKSTLTYAALEGGFRALAEDTVFLQSRPTARVWGLPGYLHLPPDAGHRFPELAGEPALRLANGKRKLAVDLKRRDALAASPVAESAAVCVLERGAGHPGLRRIDRPDLLRRLLGSLEPGFDLFADTLHEPLERLAADGGWILRLPSDPRAAVGWLHEVMDEVGSAPAP